MLDLMEKLPNRIRLQFVDGKSDRQLVDVTFEKHRAHSMDVVTSNIGVQTTTENKEGTPRAGIDALRVGSGKKIMDSGHKLMDTSDVENDENSGQHVLQVKTKNATQNWTLVAQKNSTSNRNPSSTSQNNFPCSEKGVTGNFHDSEKRQDISNASRDLLCSNSIDVLLKTTGKQVKLTENDNDLIQEKQVSSPILNSKLSRESPVFVPKCVIAKKNESRALVSNTIDLGEDSLDEDGEDNMLDLGEDFLDEDEEDMLDICFDRVAREGDISPRQQRSSRR
uniref:NB-ARC domain containing protein n=1 Tax=Solanum tuberosum TaxID=4113 RepID=M1DE21_SOLTU